MEIITIDWETYYAKDYSLTKLTTEEYIRSPMFEAIMLGIRMPDGEQRLIEGTHEEIQYQLEGIEWGRYAVLAHNTMFDGAILAWRFGIKPAVWLDTLSMARAMFGLKGNSLALLASRYNLHEKGTYVVNMMGKRRNDMSPDEFKQYADYCLHDVELCHQLFTLMSQGWYDLESVDMRHPFPIRELELIDRLIRMYTEPSLLLNQAKLEKHLEGVIKRKEALLAACAVEKDLLMSNPKFADLLQALGVAPPMKISATTGKLTFAFAKTDPGMKDLLEHPDERVQVLAAARMGVKSTLEETRTNRFIDIAKRGGYFPIPLKYSAARTHRLGGMDKINLQNLPARGKDAKRLKKAIEPPPGYIVINSDSSNIEARMLAWLAEQEDLVSDFANKVDVYSKMASRIYNREVNRKRKEVVDGKEIYPDEAEGFVGKTCLAGNSLVLCERGWIPLVSVSPADRVWDGIEWVHHQGVLKKGTKNVVNMSGIWLTPDHLVLCGQEWLETDRLLEDESILGRALVSGAETLPFQGLLWGQKTGLSQSLFHAVAVAASTLCTPLTSKLSKQPDAVCVGSRLHINPTWINTIGRMQMHSPIMSTGKGFSIGYQRRLQGAIPPLPGLITTTVNEVSKYVKNGVQTAQHFYGTYKHCLGGITQLWTWTGLTTIKGTSQGTLGLYPLGITCSTVEKYETCSQKWTPLKSNLKNLSKRTPVYDLANSGPRNRFTVLTDKGPIIVHNCVLGAGYQTGGAKLQITLKAATPPMDMPLEECTRIINTYRNTYTKIPELWKLGDKAIQAMHDDKGMWLGKEGVLLVEGKKGIKLPNGLYISYPSLHQYDSSMNGRPMKKWRYKDEKGFQDIYGGKLIENCLSGDSEVLTDSGWKRITAVSLDDRVWDGTGWVRHTGVVCNGVQQTINFGGVWMTPDHKVLVDNNWVESQHAIYEKATSSYSRSYGIPACGFNNTKLRWQQRKKIVVERAMQLWERICTGFQVRRRLPILRVQEKRIDSESTYNARHVSAPSICGLAVFSRPMHFTLTQSMGELWGQRHNGLPRMGSIFPDILERYGAYVPKWVRDRSQRQQPWVLSRELPMGDTERKHPQYTKECDYRFPTRQDNSSRAFREVWNWGDNYSVSSSSGVEEGTLTNPTRRNESVYDITNAGPNHRFTVRGKDGRPFLVHNCVQALARIIVMLQLLKISKRYTVPLTVHDSVVAIARVEESEEALAYIEECMRWIPKWAQGCPINCEAFVGANYGEC